MRFGQNTMENGIQQKLWTFLTTEVRIYVMYHTDSSAVVSNMF